MIKQQGKFLPSHCAGVWVWKSSRKNALTGCVLTCSPVCCLHPELHTDFDSDCLLCTLLSFPLLLFLFLNIGVFLGIFFYFPAAGLKTGWLLKTENVYSSPFWLLDKFFLFSFLLCQNGTASWLHLCHCAP